MDQKIVLIQDVADVNSNSKDNGTGTNATHTAEQKVIQDR
ncbi:hypothetical protein EV200_103441 [Pedobacter psychrotolerans]|uniref:Uncharacterized protein n=1 Tax=Pedobacter psychrotolerans TaxID=1843235 RepID=A0A4R2HG88_9SPHI|nr:hypothetical protein EV200_103441 [Pedobacter psychrotolerans]